MPAAKCGGCKKFISPLEAAKCSICLVLYHRACGSLPLSGFIAPTWSCSECKNKTLGEADFAPSRDLAPDQTIDSSEMNFSVSGDVQNNLPEISAMLLGFKHELRQMFKEELRAELLSMREEFNRIRVDLGQLQAERDNLKESVDMCTERMDSMINRISALEQNPESNPTAASEEVAQLKREINERDQQMMANDLEISNLPEASGENLNHTVKLIATKLGVRIEERDIVSADRIGGRQVNATSASGAVETRPRSIVVRLARRDLRDELMSAARVRRGANTADLGMPGLPRRFYLNERLTKLNRYLFRRAREAGQRLGWQFVWTKHGRILARHKPGDKASIIRSDTDLLHVFGPDAKKSPENV